MTVQFYWDGIYTVGWPSGVVHWGALLGFQGAKSLFRTVLAQAVSSLPVEPYDAVQSEKSLIKQARYTRQLLARDLFFLNSFLMFIY